MGFPSKKSSSQPAPIDPSASAAAQGALNKEAVHESARVNQINTRGPFGDVTFSGEVGAPDRTQTLTLPAEVQKILDTQTGISGDLTNFASDFAPRVADSLSTPFNTSDVSQAPTFDPDERQRIEQSLFDRINPQFDRDEDRLRSQLANQGIGQGSEAFSSAFDDFNRGKTDARLAVTNQGGAEASRSFGLESQAHQQALSDALLNRTQGLNEVSALLQGAPAINTPQVNQPSQFQVAPGDFQGAQALNTQLQIANANRNAQSNNALTGGLFSLGGSLGSAAITQSDIRLKTNIRRVGEMDNGLPVYTYRYKTGGPVQMGVMAHEVEKINPDAVHDLGGFKGVDYGAL